MVLSAIEQWGR